MDSLTTVNGAIEGLAFLLPQIITVVIVPVVMVLRMYIPLLKKSADGTPAIIPTENVTTVLAIGAAFALNAAFNYGLDPIAVIRVALEALGGGAALVGVGKLSSRINERMSG